MCITLSAERSFAPLETGGRRLMFQVIMTHRLQTFVVRGYFVVSAFTSSQTRNVGRARLLLIEGEEGDGLSI